MERQYHHGDLSNALVTAAVELARPVGPSGIVLREVARTVGLSATAAYRHFDSHESLVAAVAVRALDELAEFMAVEIAAVPRSRDPVRAALGRLAATGRGYVQFAVKEPGLFRVAFTPCPNVAPAAGDRQGPYELLCAALDGCVAAGALPPERRKGADRLAWIGVHGLALLTIDGPFPSGGPQFDELLERTLDFIADGLGCTRVTRRR
jgi:AcrR family transcriptional regulator